MAIEKSQQCGEFKENRGGKGKRLKWSVRTGTPHVEGGGKIVFGRGRESWFAEKNTVRSPVFEFRNIL